MKTCITCSETKEYIEFTKDNATKDGYRPYCRICNRIRERNRYPKYREDHLKRSVDRQTKITFDLHCLKGSIGCYKCGEDDPRALDFHHKDPTEKVDQVPVIWHNRGKEAALEEAAKCEVLCANCHRKEHVNL